MMKSSQKKGQNYIPFFQNTYPEMQRKTSSRQSGACAPGPRWVGWLRPRAACASPAPSGRGGLQPHARAASVPPAPGGQGATAAHQSSTRAPSPRLAGGGPTVCQSGARAPGPRIPSFEFTYPEIKENIYLE